MKRGRVSESEGRGDVAVRLTDCILSVEASVVRRSALLERLAGCDGATARLPVARKHFELWRRGDGRDDVQSPDEMINVSLVRAARVSAPCVQNSPRYV